MQKSHFNNNIHGLRGIAVLAVFLLHVYTFALTYGAVLPAGFMWLDRTFNTFAIGVDIFFMISGYLITASLLRHKNVKNFLVDRYIRIYPVYLVIIIPLFLLEPLLHDKWTVGITGWEYGYDLIANLLMLPGVFPTMLILGPAWTLSYEFLFYYFAATIYFFLSKKNRVIPTLLLVIAMPVLIYFYPRMIAFAGGVIVYYATQYFKKPANRLKLPAGINAFVSNGNARTQVVLFSLIAFLAFSIYAIIMSFIFNSHFDSGLPGAPINWISYLGTAQNSWLAYFAFPFGVIFFFSVVNGSKVFVNIVQSRFLQRMGTISYSYYLWHWLVFLFSKPLLLIIFARTNFFGGMIISASLMWLVTFCIASISYELLEKRTGALLKKRFGKRSSVEASLPRAS